MTTIYHVEHWLPGKLNPKTGERQPPTPCPDLLTKDEAVRILRIDELDRKEPDRTFDRIRREQGIPGTLIGGHLMYRREDLEKALMLRITETRPR